MTEDKKTAQNVYDLPTEVLLYVFTFLPAKQLTRCRQVCSRWKHIIDGMTRSDALWREYCKTDFSDLYKVARQKARVGVLWFHIYRSLSFWPRLQYARELRDEFASAGRVSDEIKNFQILRNGIIGVHKLTAIVYYDIETLEPSKRGPITGDYVHYTENDDTLVINNHHLHLFVIRKVINDAKFETNVTFDNVKTFIVVNREVYFVNLNNEVYVCQLDDADLGGKIITRSEESIMCLGYTNHLNLLTFERNIYSVINGHLVLKCALDNHSNLVHQIHMYKLLETLDWRILFQWMCVLRRKVPTGPLQDIMTVRPYGDTYFVGCNWGVLRIYHAPYTDGELDFYNAEPVKQYNFMERSDCPVLTMCPILQIDILENEDGHTVLVAMPKKIAVLDFVHNFKRTASVAMLPYCNVQRVKILKMDECI